MRPVTSGIAESAALAIVESNVPLGTCDAMLAALCG
jgi:hypothetical protein